MSVPQNKEHKRLELPFRTHSASTSMDSTLPHENQLAPEEADTNHSTIRFPLYNALSCNTLRSAPTPSPSPDSLRSLELHAGADLFPSLPVSVSPFSSPLLTGSDALPPSLLPAPPLQSTSALPNGDVPSSSQVLAPLLPSPLQTGDDSLLTSLQLPNPLLPIPRTVEGDALPPSALPVPSSLSSSWLFTPLLPPSVRHPLPTSQLTLHSGISDHEMGDTTEPEDGRRSSDPNNSQLAYEVCCNLLREINPLHRKRHFNEPVSPKTMDRSSKVRRVLLTVMESESSRILCSRNTKRSISTPRTQSDNPEQCTTLTRRIRASERRARATYELYKALFPKEIWHCCLGTCFARIASSVEVVHKLAGICSTAKRMRAEVDSVAELLESRRRGVGGSNMAFNAESRAEREEQDGRAGTDRQVARNKFTVYVERVVPFLYNDNGVQLSGVQLPRKLCTEAICLLLGISRNVLFRRKKQRQTGAHEVLESIIDKAGSRLRQHRRTGDRRGFPSISELNRYECGCLEPCFAKVPEWRLQRQYEAFLKVSMKKSPRQLEHLFLLDVMFCPLSNGTVRQCDKAIAKLFTLSEGVVGAVRRNLLRMCSDPSLNDKPLQPDWWKRGYSSANHPANRMDNETRERIENHLNMILRPDPSGADDISVCRVYSTEVNTHEKLRKYLTTMLKEDNEGPVSVSSSTLQRRINEYLHTRKLRVSFQQTDHNACPHFKAFKYACFRYHKDYKLLQAKLDAFNRQNAGSDQQSQATRTEIEALRVEVQTKKDQEEETINCFKAHCALDRDIRKVIKTLGDLFRDCENILIRQRGFSESSPRWNFLNEHGIITHQDDMTKIDLPYFVESASADITRWRFDANSHVSSVNGDAVVFSHEQGTGAKNGGCIIEEILLDHIVRCRGEAIKIIVSDNASVGKNWICTVALPQYIVDQGLSKIVLVVFLENNHGKWLADLLFGQLQTRRKQTTLLSVDDLLTEFESINRSRGRVQGFALNPLSSIDFSKVLESLGYETKPPKDFNFTKRNIHFAGAAAPGAKKELEGTLKKILIPALPDEPGMVRISSSPPSDKPLRERRYEERCFDVPAAKCSETTSARASNTVHPVSDDCHQCHTEHAVLASATGIDSTNEIIRNTTETGQPGEPATLPLVVALDKPFSLSGSGVVSHRTADHVGFNGLGFRKYPAFPELREDGTDLVRRAWPPGLLTRGWTERERGEPQFGTEVVKCAPENWVCRKPVTRMSSEGTGIKARYPPRNMLNAKYQKGPRDPYIWIPTPTYVESPFPIIRGTCAFNAMQRPSVLHQDTTRSVHFLDVLKAVFEDMGRIHQPKTCDVWLQNKATRPNRTAITKYRKELKLFVEREKDSPANTLTVRQAFKQDAEVQAKLKQTLFEKGISPKASKKRNKILNTMFEEAEKIPGGLERYEYLVERDLERCARELKEFRVVQQRFDADHELLPVSSRRSSGDRS